jgi:hypothetical protein
MPGALTTAPLAMDSGGGTMQGMSMYRLNELLGSTSSPCISVYQPTHRHHPDNQQDPVRYRNLVTEVEA